jgi:hypothetical protein
MYFYNLLTSKVVYKKGKVYLNLQVSSEKETVRRQLAAIWDGYSKKEDARNWKSYRLTQYKGR